MSFIGKLLNDSDKQGKANPSPAYSVQPNLFRDTGNKNAFAKNMKWMMGFTFLVIAIGFVFILDHQKTEKELHHVSQRLTTSSSASDNIKSSVTETNINQQEDQDYQKAMLLIKSNQNAQAVTYLTSLLQTNPTFQKIRETLAVLFIQNDNVSSAMDVLNKGLATTPDYTPFIKLKAQIFFNERLYDDALMLLKENMPDIHQDPDYYALMAAVYNKEKEYLIAAGLYQQLTLLNPDNGQWWFGLGASLNLAGKDDQAKIAYENALQTENLNPDVRAYLETKLNQ